MDEVFVNSITSDIMNVLKCAPEQLMSWGANRFKATVYRDMAALQFRVQGFIHKGVVIVAYNEGHDLYEVYCLGSKQQVVSTREHIYFDLLSKTIDEMVEKDCSDELYNAKIGEWLNKQYNKED